MHDLTVPLAQLETEGKVVLDHDGGPVLVLWNGGQPIAMDDTCIHRQRSLREGFLFADKIVCPGHQWAFRLTDGYCEARDRHQPVHDVTVVDDQVVVGVRRDAISATRSAGH